MRRLVVLCTLLLFIEYINAQVVENPVFDRTDFPAFRVETIKITEDTTYVYCAFNSKGYPWANISKNTYIETTPDRQKYQIIKISGIPFEPEKRLFAQEEEIQIVMYFPHISANKINIIEDENEEAFNIYGIDLTSSYVSSFTANDIETFFISNQKMQEERNWTSALDYTFKQLDASNYVWGIKSYASACSMFNLSMVFLRIEDYHKVIEWGKKAIDILCVLPPDSIYLDVLARAYGNVGTAYKLLNQHDSGNFYMELSLATRRLMNGVSTLNYEEYLRELASHYYYEQNYPKALLYGKEVADIYERKFKENKLKYGCIYIASLSNLCEFYQSMAQYEEACKAGRNAVRLINEGFCDDNNKYYLYLNLAAALLSFSQVDEGIAYLEKIINDSESLQIGSEKLVNNTKMLLADVILKEKKDTAMAIKINESVLKAIEDSMVVGKYNYPDYSSILHHLYKAYIIKNKSKGLYFLEKAIQVEKEWHGEESVSYANLLIQLVNETFADSIIENNTDSLYQILKHSSDIVKRHIGYANYNMSKWERKDYWGRYKHVFTWLIPVICHFLDKPKWNALGYDAALFYKGMLLESETEFKSLIYSSNDCILEHLYSSYVQDINKLERILSLSHATTDIDSLKSRIRNEEYLLSQKVSRFDRQYKTSHYSWLDVKDALSDNDVAIEIVSYEVSDTTLFYDAYVITKELEPPQKVPLFEDLKRDHNNHNDINYNELSYFIWNNEDLSKIIGNRRNIYFSTSGILNLIGIEYLPLSRNTYANEKYNLFRVSSTRELCRKGDITIKNAHLYGGLDYDIVPISSSSHRYDNHDLSRSVRESLRTRGDFEPLVGSGEEVEQVMHELTNKAIHCVIFNGVEGTEESIKSCSGSEVNLIHLSTHGMYITDENNELGENNNYRFIMPNESSYIDEEEKSLSRSFLVMSGGNALIHRENIEDGADDGILTALEISHLDFTNLNLVVLSACETALGKNDTEGIYGLQRGFKKAGANTILMSLDKVDDEATKLLMVEFYRNLMSGKTKHESLQEAQQYLRKVDNGKYDNPKYWASFIMLDGLN